MIAFVGNILEGLYQFSVSISWPSYALAIIILTIIIKLILIPLNVKQIKSMRQIQQIQPLMKEIEKKYANNPQKKQEEQMKLYQDHKINPLAGCLPLLVQMPILIILYQGLIKFEPLNPEHYNFFWLVDLGVPDPSGWILPILMIITTLTQSLTSSGIPKDKNSKLMVYGLPLLMGWWGRTFPSGVCLYWIVFAIIGTIQQIIINKGFDPMKTREKALPAAEATIDVSAPAEKPKKPQQNRSRKKK